MGEPRPQESGDETSHAETTCRNAFRLPLDRVVRLALAAWRQTVLAACSAGGRIVAYFALPSERAGEHDVFLILADDGARLLRPLRTSLAAGEALPSLATDAPEVQAFEREIHEEHGIPISGHPWLKPLRRHPALTEHAGDGDADATAPGHPFFEVGGAGVHEVAVGPVHAGIIEPGHFRFQCHGEHVISLEIHLGYQHRGAEALLRDSHPARRLAVAESIAGDTAVGHALAHCLAMEALGGASVPPTAESLRVVALELERLANHVGDLGALSGDVAYLPGASYFGRLRGGLLNLLMELSGNRHGRGLLCPGGVHFGLSKDERQAFVLRLGRMKVELESVAHLLFETPSVRSRFEGTGALSEAVARQLGLVGPAARACGLARDVRVDHPAGLYRSAPVAVAVATGGGVMARAMVRWLEVERSLAYVIERLQDESVGPLSCAVSAPPPQQLVVALVEGWRGEIAHVAVTGAAGQLRGYKVVDPSFHNWFGLAMALRGCQISDFPLCNKSFNLSYAGHDL